MDFRIIIATVLYFLTRYWKQVYIKKKKDQTDGVFSLYDAVFKIIPRNCHSRSVFLTEYLKGKKLFKS